LSRLGNTASALAVNEVYKFLERRIDQIIIGHELSEYAFSGSTIFVGERVLIIAEESELAELEKDVVQSICFLSGNAFGNVHPVSGKTLKCKVLRTSPGLDLYLSDTGKVGNNEAVDAVVLRKISERLLVILHSLRVETVDPDAEGQQKITGGKIVCCMNTIETGGFHSNDHRF
jgi:hypothetical protein